MKLMVEGTGRKQVEFLPQWLNENRTAMPLCITSWQVGVQIYLYWWFISWKSMIFSSTENYGHISLWIGLHQVIITVISYFYPLFLNGELILSPKEKPRWFGESLRRFSKRGGSLLNSPVCAALANLEVVNFLHRNRGNSIGLVTACCVKVYHICFCFWALWIMSVWEWCEWKNLGHIRSELRFQLTGGWGLQLNESMKRENEFSTPT